MLHSRHTENRYKFGENSTLFGVTIVCICDDGAYQITFNQYLVLFRWPDDDETVIRSGRLYFIFINENMCALCECV